MNRFLAGFAVAIIVLNPKTTVHVVSTVLNCANSIVARFSYDSEKK